MESRSQTQLEPQSVGPSANETDEPEPLPSIGSAKHYNRTCKPCFFIKTSRGCTDGSACKFCHLHVKKLRPRPGKSARAAAKSLANNLLDNLEDNEDVMEAAAELEGQSQYMKAVVKKKLEMKGLRRNIIEL